MPNYVMIKGISGIVKIINYSEEKRIMSLLILMFIGESLNFASFGLLAEEGKLELKLAPVLRQFVPIKKKSLKETLSPYGDKHGA